MNALALSLIHAILIGLGATLTFDLFGVGLYLFALLANGLLRVFA